MPQSNITYDTPYNKELVRTLQEMEKKQFNYNRNQYDPSPMGFRNADSFHHPEKVAQVQVKLTGGVAPSKYILNGNSPAYPPLNMNAGLAVSSGGGRNRYAGVDGAVGGSFLSDALNVAKVLAPVVAPLLKGGVPSGGVSMSGGVPSGGFNFSKMVKNVGKAVKTGAEVAKTGKEAYDIYKSVMGGAAPYDLKKLQALSKKMKGGNWLSDAFNVVKQIAPIVAPLMLGAGRCKMCDKVAMVEKAMTTLHGGSFWSDFGKGFVKGFTGTLGVAKDLAPVVLPFLGKGRKKGGAMVGAYLGTDGQVHHGANVGRKVGGVKSGGVNLKDAIAFTKDMGSKAVKVIKKRGVKALKAVADDLKASVVREATKAVSGGGRSARAAIVKKVMAEKGLKMIQASQYVKEHGLYKK